MPLGFGSNILKFDQLPFLSPLSQEGVTYLFRKANAMPVEKNVKLGENSPYVTKSGNFLGSFGFIGLRLC